MFTVRRLTIGIAILATAFLGASEAARKKGPAGQSFDYYLLTLSWAPDFCAATGSTDPNECGAGNHVGFVVHGLWPQSEQGQGPQNCGSAAPVPQPVVDATLPYIPTAGLIAHEWATHGTCSGLAADAYFATLRKARDSVSIPPDFAALTQPATKSPADVQALFAAANPAFPAAAFRATCTKGALQEARICFDKNLQARACTAGAGSCASSTMRILPPR